MSAQAVAVPRRRLFEPLPESGAPRRWGLARRVVGVLWWASLVYLVIAMSSRYLLDLEVYRNGGIAWLRGIPLYRDFPGPLEGPRLPFTYPPAAAVLFTLFGAVPSWLADTLVTAGSFVALTAVCVIVAGRLIRRKDIVWTVALAAAVLGVWAEPVISTFEFGQVNLILMALVVIDLLVVRDRRYRGLLIGLAAAIKLTPAVFVLFFLLRKDWRAALNSIGAFVALALAGFAFAPSDSTEYWFHALLDPTRIGGVAYGTNQSLQGFLYRLDLGKEVISPLWLVLAAVVMLLAALIAHRSEDEVLGMLAIALGGLLASPVSWSHHWVWCVPVLLVLAVRARQWWQWVLFGGVFVVAYAHPFRAVPMSDNRELAWTLWQHIPGNAYIWVSVAALIALAVLSLRRPAAAR